MTEPEPEYELLMPFVVCRPDGPYDAKAFVAGWECGAIDAAVRTLKTVSGVIERWVKPDVIPQLDLIAMRYGQKFVRLDDSEDGEWTRVRIGHPLLVEGGTEE